MLKEIEVPAEFVSLASDWHGGQDSMLYAIASTGNLTPRALSWDENNDAHQVHLFSILEMELRIILDVMTQKPTNFTDEERNEITSFYDWASSQELELEELYISKHGEDE
jgi:hypothetical protein